MKTRLLAVPAILVLSLTCMPVKAYWHMTPEQQQQLAGIIVPLSDIGDRRIVIDGDLSDWGDLRDQGFALHQHFLGIYPCRNPPAADAALVKLMRSSDAIYVAVRIRDDSVVSPGKDANPFSRDFLQFMLDLRLPMREKIIDQSRPVWMQPHELGGMVWDRTNPYALLRSLMPPGIFEINVSPPPDEGGEAQWAIEGGAGPIGPIDVASRRVAGGYTVEMRLPLASLLQWVGPDGDRAALPAEYRESFDALTIADFHDRLSRKIGFDVIITDVDLDAGGNRVRNRHYGWSYQLTGTEMYRLIPGQWMHYFPHGYAWADPGFDVEPGAVMQTRPLLWAAAARPAYRDTNRPAHEWEPEILPSWSVKRGRAEPDKVNRDAYYYPELDITFLWPGRRYEWFEHDSVPDICRQFPDEIRRLLDALDPAYAGMAEVIDIWAGGDMTGAAQAFVEWFKQQPVEPMPPLYPRVLHDVMHHYMGIRDGFLVGDFMRNYPEHKGHVRWGWANSITYQGYHYTRDPAFIAILDLLLRSRLAEEWRARDTVDPDVFANIQGSFMTEFNSAPFPFTHRGYDAVTPATILLLHARVPEIAELLLSRDIPPASRTDTQLFAMGNLLQFLERFPMFKSHEDWHTRIIGRMDRAINGGFVYPDGASLALSPVSQKAALFEFLMFAELSTKYGLKLPTSYDESIERMLSFLIYSTRPDSRLPLNNTAAVGDRWDTGSANRLSRHGGVFGDSMRADWRYVVSNGKEGERPPGAPSRFFPWAGQLISRSGWDADAHWSFFDVGPTGIADGHLDKLHLSISAYGMDMLEDTGVHGLTPPSRSSRAHNVVLVDGRDQAGEPLYAEQPVPDSDFRITPEFDFARGSVNAFQGVAGAARHTRALMVVRGRFWVVVDRIGTDRPRDVTANWQFHPACSVERADALRPSTAGGSGWGEVGGGLVDSIDLEAPDVIGGDFRMEAPGNWQFGQAVLRIKPFDDGGISDWKLSIRNDGRYGSQPAPGHGETETQPRMNRAVYEKRINTATTFGWLLLPAAKAAPAEAEATLRMEGDVAIVTVTVAGQDPLRLTIPLAGMTDPALDTGSQARRP